MKKRLIILLFLLAFIPKQAPISEPVPLTIEEAADKCVECQKKGMIPSVLMDLSTGEIMAIICEPVDKDLEL